MVSRQVILTAVLISFLLHLTVLSFGKDIPRNAIFLDSIYQELVQARREKNDVALANLYFQLAEYQEYVMENPEKAFGNYVSAKQYFELQNDELKVNLINRKIAKRYEKSELYDQAIKLYQKLINFYRSIGDKRSEALVLHDLAECFKRKGEPDRMVEYLNKSLALNIYVQDTSLMILHLFDKVQAHLLLNELDSALVNSTKALNLSIKINDKSKSSESNYYIGYINYLLKKADIAERFFRKSLLESEGETYSEIRKKAFFYMGELFLDQELHQSATYYLKKYNEVSDSIFARNKRELLENLTIKFESNERKKDIKLLELEKETIIQRALQQQNLVYFLLGGLGLLLVFVYTIIRFYTAKIRTEQIVSDQQTEINNQKIRELESAIKINSMQSMLVGQEKERERISKDLHDSLGGLLSTVKLQFEQLQNRIFGNHTPAEYAQASRLLDSAIEEVRSISRNLQPVALKKLGLVPALKDLINRFDGEGYPEVILQTYDVPNKIDSMVSLSVFRIIQELLNNTIKHGKADEILIQINGEKEELIVQYEDDGIGFDPEGGIKKGMGLDNIQSRINYLKGTISIESKMGEGLYVRFNVPCDLQEAELPAL